jgi:NDP-sugar pyrophosphorylase family protein
LSVQCVILAGGLGTRMRPLTDQLPKALLPVNGAPFAHHQLTLLAAEGVTDVVYSVGHRGEMIVEAVGDGSTWGLTVRYVFDGTQLRGTAGALRLALDAGVLDRSFLVLYGDSYLPIAYRPVVDAFERTELPALMTVLRNDDRWDASNVCFEGGRLLSYDKQRRRTDGRVPRHIDYGLSVLERSLIEEQVPPDEVADLSDLFHRLSVEQRLAGLEVDRRFFEIGSPEGLAALEQHLRSPDS